MATITDGVSWDLGDMVVNTITIPTTPVNPTDGVNKQYADAIASGINIKGACQYASTINYPCVYSNGSSGVGATIVPTATGVFSIDGANPPISTRVLIKNQASSLQNGIYILNNVGTVSTSPVLTRTSDFDTTADVVEGSYVLVLNGTPVNANTGWVMASPNPVTIGTSAIVFNIFSNLSSALLKVNNLSDVANVSTARTNLGLGTAALLAATDFIASTAVGSGGDLSGPILSATVIAATTSAAGKVQLATSAQTTAGLAIQANDPRLTNARSPIGSASGDLTGTYPSPTILSQAVTFAKIQTVPASCIIANASGVANAVGPVTLSPSLSFNGTTLQRSALTGDISANAGSNATTLANTGITANTYSYPTLTADSKGRITAIASNPTSKGNVTTNSSGFFTFAHGLGTPPTVAFAMATSTGTAIGTQYYASITVKDATNISGNVVASGALVGAGINVMILALV